MDLLSLKRFGNPVRQRPCLVLLVDSRLRKSLTCGLDRLVVQMGIDCV